MEARQQDLRVGTHGRKMSRSELFDFKMLTKTKPPLGVALSATHMVSS